MRFLLPRFRSMQDFAGQYAPAMIWLSRLNGEIRDRSVSGDMSEERVACR